jgi:hypothetical protein
LVMPKPLGKAKVQQIFISPKTRSQISMDIFLNFAADGGALPGSLPAGLNRESGANPGLCPQLCNPPTAPNPTPLKPLRFEKAGARGSQKTCHRQV